MATATIQFSASGINSGGETKQLSSSGQIQCTQLTSGTQTLDTTYAPLATAAGNCTAVVVYNKGTKDVSIRMDLGAFATGKRYHVLNCIAGGIVIVPGVIADGNFQWQALAARTESGSGDVDYCVIR